VDLIAGFVVLATSAAASAGMAPRWLRLLGWALAALLPLGGAAFLVDSGILTAALFASPPLLLLWAGAVALIVGRRALESHAFHIPRTRAHVTSLVRRRRR
jgi:hypothetical protein